MKAQSVKTRTFTRMLRHALRLAGRNALVLIVGLALVALAGELYFRLTAPFMPSGTWPPSEFVPGLGYVRKPGAEYRATNGIDYWTVSRANRLGFFDRPPLPNPERAAASCHVAMFGASFVEAVQVPVEDKFHVRLEEFAADALPHLDVTTSAFGIGGTGQAQHLAFYDVYARPLRPKLLVLVVSPTDFSRNSPILEALTRGWDPEYLPHYSIERRADGRVTLRPPHPDHAEFRLPRPSVPPELRAADALGAAIRFSWFARWLDVKTDRLLASSRPGRSPPELIMRMELLSRRPRYATLLEGLEPAMLRNTQETFARRDPPPAFAEALDNTAFALGQFKERANRDGATLVVLAVHRYRTSPHRIRLFRRLSEMAGHLSIPVIDQGDYILRQGAAVKDAQWPNDGHWNAAGHRWAAEALLEHIERRPEVCR